MAKIATEVASELAPPPPSTTKVLALPSIRLKSVFRDAAIYFAARTLPVIVQLAVSLALLRYAGPEQYVDYTLHLGLVLALATVTSAWLTQGLIRHPELVSEQGQAFAVIVLGSSLTLLVTTPVTLLIVAAFLDNSNIGMTSVAFLYIAAFLYLVQLHAIVGRAMPVLALLAEGLRSLILVLGSTVVISLELDQQAKYMLWLSAASFLSAAFVGHAPQSMLVDWRAGHFSLRFILKSDVLASAWVIFALALFLIDRLSLAGIVSPAMLAAYIFTADVTQRAAQFLISPLGLVLQPRMAAATKANGIAAGYTTVHTPMIVQLVVTFGAGALGATVGTLALDHALGSAAAPAQAVLVPLIAAALLWQTATLWQKPLEFGGLLSLTTLSVAGAAGFQACVVMLFGETYGIVAAAWGLLVSVALYSVGLFVIATRIMRKK